MNIAIFTNNYLPNPFGVAGSIESFRKELERLGHTVHIFAPAFARFVDENPHVHRYPSLKLQFKNIQFPIAIPCSYKMDKILETLDIDVIHAQHPNLLGWEARRWAQKKHVPLIFTWHTLYDQYAHFVSFVPTRAASWWSIRNAVRYANGADHVIVPTPSVQEIITRWGVTNRSITAIPTGVEQAQFDGAKGSGIRKKYAIPDDAVVLCLVSRMTAEKNVEFVAQCVFEILTQCKDVYFVCSALGNLAEKIQHMATAHKELDGRVVFFDSTQDRKEDVFAAGDIFVYGSKSETQGMVLTEAMYAGLPIVAVRAPGVRDIVRSGETGLLVEEDAAQFISAAKELIDDEEKRKAFGMRAKAIAHETYTAAVCAQQLLTVYQRHNKTL